MAMQKTIKISNETKEIIDALKISKTESYDKAIKRILLEEILEPYFELSDEVKKSIAESKAARKRGEKFYTTEELIKEILGDE